MSVATGVVGPPGVPGGARIQQLTLFQSRFDAFILDFASGLFSQPFAFDQTLASDSLVSVYTEGGVLVAPIGNGRLAARPAIDVALEIIPFGTITRRFEGDLDGAQVLNWSMSRVVSASAGKVSIILRVFPVPQPSNPPRVFVIGGPGLVYEPLTGTDILNAGVGYNTRPLQTRMHVLTVSR
jgi:hypothetical protein